MCNVRFARVGGMPALLCAALAGCVGYAPGAPRIYVPPPAPAYVLPPYPAPYPPPPAPSYPPPAASYPPATLQYPPPPPSYAPAPAVAAAAAYAPAEQPAAGDFAPPVPALPAEAAYEVPAPAISVYAEPPLQQPDTLVVPWAPPPMLVEEPAPEPFPDAVWIGGFWVWQGTWVWDYGRWVEPPQPGYVWVQPYYEHRGEVVLFITGHWEPAGVPFLPPPPGLRIEVERALPGAYRGAACIGPQGVFVPAPPGSRPGIIVPAPMGTAPAVVTSAPAVMNVGMRIVNVTKAGSAAQVRIVAPASATMSGRALNAAVPAQAHLAAALPARVHAAAPQPEWGRPIRALRHGAPPPWLPAPKPVRATLARPLRMVRTAPAVPQRAMQAAPAALPVGRTPELGLPLEQHDLPASAPLQPLEQGPAPAAAGRRYAGVAPHASLAPPTAPPHPTRAAPPHPARTEPAAVTRPAPVAPPAMPRPPVRQATAAAHPVQVAAPDAPKRTDSAKDKERSPH